MPRFSKVSNDRLDTCNETLRFLFQRIVSRYDCSILEGYRGKDDQDKYYMQGKSKLKWPKSKHNKKPSNAVHVAPWPIDWKNFKRFYHFAGYVLAIADEEDIRIRWGGDWDMDKDFDDQRFNDLIHFELVSN